MSRLDLETSIAYWEQAAGELLSRDPSEETRIVIEQGTKTIYKVLKNKISEVGDTLHQIVKDNWA